MRSSLRIFIACLFCIFLGACNTIVNGGGSNNSVPLSGKMGSDSVSAFARRTLA